MPIAVFLGYHRYLKSRGNFHAVIPGTLYRSGLLSPQQMQTYQDQAGFGSIINLLGDRTGKDWYDGQRKAAQDFGAQHYDFRIPAVAKVPERRAMELVDLMAHAPKPILIHCKSGSDRTGLAAALYLRAIENVDAKTAAREMSLRYGHIGVPYISQAYAMRESWNGYQRWLSSLG